MAPSAVSKVCALAFFPDPEDAFETYKEDERGEPALIRHYLAEEQSKVHCNCF